MKKTVTSTFMYIASMIFLLLVLIAYSFIAKNITKSNEKDQKLIYYQINFLTDNLLSKIMFEYEKQKNELKNKHQEVLEYFKTHDYDISLDEIYEKINSKDMNKPYNILITDKNLVINNTTYKQDLGFDLSFAKYIFDKHKAKNIIGVSEPIFTSQFFSYTDSYFPKDDGKRLLQISYRYNVPEEIKKLKILLETNQYIDFYSGYLKYTDDFIVKINLKDIREKKSTLAMIYQESINGQKIFNKLQNQDLVIEKVNEDNIYFYAKVKNKIFDNVSTAFSLSLNNKYYNNLMNTLNLFTSLFALIGLILIWIIYKFNNSEKELERKNRFIGHAVHEIKTPLSIITLNSQLRAKVMGRNNYDKQIDGAIRTLKNSYDDMTFLLTKDQIDYELEDIFLCEFLAERVKYFSDIALTQSRTIKLTKCKEKYKYSIKISAIELTRLIDNNLSNAIKYSHVNSSIEVDLSSKNLTFTNRGETIRDMKEIFKKYTRQSEFSGGHGLGLSIVKDICDKYNIFIKVSSENSITKFSYTFSNLAHESDNKSV